MMGSFNDISLSRTEIIERAEKRWDDRTSEGKIKKSNKYHHIINKIGSSNKLNPWTEKFSNLSQDQKRLLIRGELIRTYDSLSNQEKTKIKERLKLSTFSSKWFRLPPNDKKKILLKILS